MTNKLPGGARVWTIEKERFQLDDSDINFEIVQVANGPMIERHDKIQVIEAAPIQALLSEKDDKIYHMSRELEAVSQERDALRAEVDKTYQEWVGRDFMHLALSEAVGKVRGRDLDELTADRAELSALKLASASLIEAAQMTKYDFSDFDNSGVREKVLQNTIDKLRADVRGLREALEKISVFFLHQDGSMGGRAKELAREALNKIKGG